MDEGIEVQPERLLQIVKEENPLVYELALRRAIIEQQRQVIETLHAATLNGDTEVSQHTS